MAQLNMANKTPVIMQQCITIRAAVSLAMMIGINVLPQVLAPPKSSATLIYVADKLQAHTHTYTCAHTIFTLHSQHNQAYDELATHKQQLHNYTYRLFNKVQLVFTRLHASSHVNYNSFITFICFQTIASLTK